MYGLRWTLLIVTALVAVGWIALLAFADGFRRSFGASDNALWKLIGPLFVMAALLASLTLPGQRVVQHSVAGLAVALAVGCGWLFRQSPGLSITGLIYLGLWFVYYWHALGR